MIKAGVAQSAREVSFEAGQEASEKAIARAGGKADLLVVFSTVNYNQEQMLGGVKAVAKNSLVVGCSGLRGIFGSQGVEKGVVAMAVASDQIRFKVGLGLSAKEDSFLAGKTIAHKIVDSETKALIIFLESIGVNGSAVVRGIQEGARKNLPIIGGMASDASTLTKTYQYCIDKVYSNAVVGLGLSGDFSFGMGVQHGWQSVGLPVAVTKSKGSVIEEIGNKPAMKFFEDYFGQEEAKQLYKPLSRICYAYPLGINVEGSDELLIRNAFVANEKGEIICAGEVPQGSQIRLMLGDTEKAIKAARDAANNAKEQLAGKTAKAVFVFNCAARFMLLGKRVDEEIKAIQEVFGENVPMIGFYTYGEQAPIAGDIGQNCCSLFHNETMTLMVVGE